MMKKIVKDYSELVVKSQITFMKNHKIFCAILYICCAVIGYKMWDMSEWCASRRANRQAEMYDHLMREEEEA